MACKIIETDIFTIHTDAIIHQANGVFNRGFAKILRQRYPELSRADKATDHKTVAPKVGFSCIRADDGKYLFNLYSQFNFGFGDRIRHTDYEQFFKGMQAIEYHARQLDIQVLSVPYNIGCGLGGADWRIIQAMLEVIFENSLLVLTICKKPQRSLTLTNTDRALPVNNEV